MFQIEIDKKYRDLDTKTVFVNKSNEKMVISYKGEELFELEIPEDLKNSFDLIPEKRGYIRKNEYGNVFFTLIRYLDYHLHSEYSLLDGANKISNIVKKSEGCTAITDHGCMFGTLAFFKSMDAQLKKPIIGIEVYTETIDGQKKGCHMVLLVKNEIGWKNICKIVSEAETNFYKKPHVSYDMLEKYHEGLICTSACLGGEIQEALADNEYDKAEEIVEILKGIFKDDFYLEIQEHNIGSFEEIINNHLWDLSAIHDIKVVGAIDSHYTDKEDGFVHEILLCIGTKKKLSDNSRFKFEGENYYLRTGDEFEELFKDTPELIYNTLEMVDKCTFRFDLGTQNMPKFDFPNEFKTEDEYFEYLCNEGYKYRLERNEIVDTKEYQERLKYEIEQIIRTGFSGYLCIVQDYVIWAKENNIYVGPGRGSCVGSLACFCLRITELDPIPYGLLFERFINPERISPPDIDMDFEDEKRQDVIEYIKQKYGADHVSNIITFGTLAARNVIRDVGRVLESNTIMIDKLAKSVPAEVHMTLDKALKVSPDFKDLYESDDDARKVVDIARKLEGLAKNKSQHACFDKDTLITTKKGQKRIIDVTIGDMVLTHNMRYKPVVDLIETETYRVYTIKTESGNCIEVTENHPMLVSRGNEKNLQWIAVKDLQIDDWLIMYTYLNPFYDYTEIISIEYEDKYSKMYNLTVLDDSSYFANNLCAHNCGIIVANAPIRDYVPEVLMEDKNNKDEDGKPLKTRTAAFNKEEVEELGLLKMDVRYVSAQNIVETQY